MGLAMDSFSVSLCSGLPGGRSRTRHALRIALVMGAFQAAMPVAGWLGGNTLSQYISGVDHWIAFGLLALVGGRMIYGSLWGGADDTFLDTGNWRPLLVLGLATSIDALAVGVSLALLTEGILGPIVVIGTVTFALCFVGVLLGCRAGRLLQERMPLLGGVVLVAIGVRILTQHLMA
jgi:manganese efflux pump family protein